MEITSEIKAENEKTIIKLFSCLCGETVIIGEPILKKGTKVLSGFKCICPACKTNWKVKVNFTEI